MSVWEIFKRHVANDIHGLPFRTSLLGNPPYVERDGRLTGVIPDDLQNEARANGFQVLAAFFREGQYLLQPVVAVSPNRREG